MVHTLNLKGPTSFLIQEGFSLYRGLNLGPSEPESEGPKSNTL